MNKSYIYHPTYFFLGSLTITSIIWFAAAYISYQPSLHYLLFPLILAGMSGPSIAAFMTLTKSHNNTLWNNFYARLHPNKIKIPFIPIVLLFMPCVISLAIVISSLFGFSTNPLALSQTAPDQVLEGNNLLIILMIIFLSCSLEEIGWRGYGIDSLNSTFNLWHTSLIFAAIWSLWHVPAFFIKDGYFQKELWDLGTAHVLTYFTSLFPITIVINWLYVKNNRSILIAILFHTVMNLSYGIFQVQLYTKIILMILLLLIAGILVTKDKEIFFE